MIYPTSLIDILDIMIYVVGIAIGIFPLIPLFMVVYSIIKKRINSSSSSSSASASQSPCQESEPSEPISSSPKAKEGYVPE